MKRITRAKKMPARTTVLCCILILAVSVLSGCRAALSDPVSVTGYKLNTYVTLTAYTAGRNRPSEVSGILDEALALCDTYENIFSRTKSSSVLYQVNHHERTEIPAELAKLIQIGIDYSRLSEGAFDLTIGSVSQLWDFTAQSPTVPPAEAISAALPYVDYTQIRLTPKDENTYVIDLPENTVIDLGAIAKGYIADRIKDFLLEKGIDRAVINLGGNVLCVGQKKNGTDFSIGVRRPFSTDNTPLVTLKLNDRSAVSSGTYERYFYQDDILYHHILDPKTGYPYQNQLTDVTIISADSVTGDCLSTTCFALGAEDGMALIESLDGVEAMFVSADGTQRCSSGFSQYFAQ